MARRTRWRRNLGLTLINTALLRVVFPAGAVSAAVWSAQRGFGLLHLVDWHPVFEIVLVF